MSGVMFNLSRFNNVKKKRKKRIKKTPTRLEKYSKRLNKNLPASEKWFRSLWDKDITQHEYTMYKDLYNIPLGKYIPDVHNIGYKYVIEIDGSIHEDPNIKLKDQIKDFYYTQKGYKVFRIKAYDNESYQQALVNILLCRKLCP